jgi:hypothetical protein
LPVSCPPANLKSIINAYHNRIGNLEAEKYDLEYEVARKNLEVRPCKALGPQHVRGDQGVYKIITIMGTKDFGKVMFEKTF